MTVYSKIFYALAAIILLATGLAITRRNQVHAVLCLVVSFLSTAVLFFLLGAPLVAAFEVIIYAGAIMVLFLFILMSMRNEEPKKMERPLINPWAIPLTLGASSLPFIMFYIFSDPDGKIVLLPAMASPMKFGQFLFSDYWLPVEIVSFLLFVALVGALYLGRHEEKREEGDEQGRGQVVDPKKDVP